MRRLYSVVDGITLTYGDIRRVGFTETLPVYFEREASDGDFDFAEGVAPQCTFQRSRGFSELELGELAQYLRNNLLLLFEDAREQEVVPHDVAERAALS